ncbi:IS110 family transposase [Arthrobacter sp. TMS2-4]
MSETEVQDRRVVVGIGTHADTHHVAVVTEYGKPLADQKFPTTAVGYQEALDFITGFGEVLQAGMEGTGTYGAAPTKILLGERMLVIEVNSLIVSSVDSRVDVAPPTDRNQGGVLEGC